MVQTKPNYNFDIGREESSSKPEIQVPDSIYSLNPFLQIHCGWL